MRAEIEKQQFQKLFSPIIFVCFRYFILGYRNFRTQTNHHVIAGTHRGTMPERNNTHWWWRPSTNTTTTITTGVRNPTEAKKVVEKYLEHSKLASGAKLHYEQLDIGSMKSVRTFAGKIQSKFDKIHILINNGTYWLLGWVKIVVFVLVHSLDPILAWLESDHQFVTVFLFLFFQPALCVSRSNWPRKVSSPTWPSTTTATSSWRIYYCLNSVLPEPRTAGPELSTCRPVWTKSVKWTTMTSIWRKFWGIDCFNSSIWNAWLLDVRGQFCVGIFQKECDADDEVTIAEASAIPSMLQGDH